MDELNRFEEMLVNEGALVLKFWIHLSKDGQRERLESIEANPLTRWRVTKASWDRLKTYDKMLEVAGHLLRRTSTPWAPWIIVEGTDDRYRSLTVGKTILESLQKRLADKRVQTSPVAPPFSPRFDTSLRAELAGHDAEVCRRRTTRPNLRLGRDAWRN